jgi:hypothetical protein
MIQELIHPIHHVYQIDQVFEMPPFVFDISLFQGNGTSFKYNGTPASSKSSLTILSGSLPSNQTYQFMVLMQNRYNPSLQATGYLLVQVDDTYHQTIAIA